MSKSFKSVVIAALIASMAISPALADPRGYRGGGHGHGGGAWGALGLALFGTVVYLAATAPPPPRYPAPVYVQPPVVVTQAAPAPAPATPEYWWYYCAQPAGYYPYIQACPTGWTRVSPVPPGQ